MNDQMCSEMIYPYASFSLAMRGLEVANTLYTNLDHYILELELKPEDIYFALPILNEVRIFEEEIPSPRSILIKYRDLKEYSSKRENIFTGFAKNRYPTHSFPAGLSELQEQSRKRLIERINQLN